MADLASRLQTALGDTYRIEKELGGGGMSRVFLAEEVRLGRKVVIKLLPPEMSAGVSVDRFEREIQLSASLQHPHIVPLLTAGSHDDLLYYVMPYIEGESLRAKLAREGELPVGETVRILQDVLDALQYAHSHNVVHRDIKPDNILLSGKHAVVTDFGVAKAVSASTGESSLTSLGVALGTPSYMSPEQAAADPHVDHRADIYAVGVLAYEMLSGRPPFTGTNAQQVLSAHMTQAPEPVATHRETVPAELNDVVMRCLHKKPADRWQRADEMVPHLDAFLTPRGGMTPTGTQPVQTVSISSAERAAQNAHPMRVLGLFGLASVGALAIVYLLVQLIGLPDWVFYGAIGLLAVGLPIVFLTGRRERQVAMATMAGMSLATPVGLERHFTWRKSILGGGLAFGSLAVLAAIYMAMRTLGIGPVGTLVASGVLGERERIVLAEFENRTSDTTLGPTVTELLRVGLTQSTIVSVLEPTEVRGVLQRMERDPDTPLDRDLALEVAERDGIEAVITGEISPVGDGFALSARLISSTGEVLTAQQAAASDASQLIEAVGKLSGKLRERIGESLRDIRREPLDQVTTGSLEALRLYTQALNAENAGDDARAVQLLEDAVSVDTAFAMAYRKLGAILGNNFEQRARMIEASTKAYEHRDRLTERERHHAIALYHIRVTGQREAAISAYQTLLDRYPDDGAAINNTGVLYSQLRVYAKAAEYYRRALALDSSVRTYYTNVARNQGTQGKLDDAEATLQLFAARFPDNPSVNAVGMEIMVLRRDYGEAERLQSELREAQRGNLAWRAQTSLNLGNLALLRGKVTEAQRYRRDELQAIEGRGLKSEYLAASVRMAEGDAFVKGDVQAGLERVEAALEKYPLDSLAVPDRPYGLLVWFYARANRLDDARGFLSRFGSEIPDKSREEELGYQWSRGVIALAEGRAAEAIPLIRRHADESNCDLCALQDLARAYDAAGEVDSALAVYEQYANASRTYRLFFDDTNLPVTYVRLGELYEERGDRDKAVEYYDKFVDLWKDADAELQPQVKDVRERIAKLVGER